MAWRPTKYLIEGELDNTQHGKVTGWMRYYGLNDRILFDLDGDFHRDIRGAKIHFYGAASERANIDEALSYIEGFAFDQTGKVGDITAGLPPHDYVDYPYIEWYSDQNGRVVLELDSKQIEVIGTPIPSNETEPISQDVRDRNLTEFLYGLRDSLGKGTEVNTSTTQSPDYSGGRDDLSPRNGGGQQ